MLLKNGETQPERVDNKGTQNTELFLLSADSPERLAGKAGMLAGEAVNWSKGQFAEAARATACNTKRPRTFRLGIVAADPANLSAAAAAFAAAPLGQEHTANAGVFAGYGEHPQRLVFAFPQTNRLPLMHESLWRQRFWECPATASELEECQRSPLPPRTLAALRNFGASYAGWRLMQRCNIAPAAVIGIGSGALLACAAAGVVDEDDLPLLAVNAADGRSLDGCLSGVAFDDPLLPVYSADSGLPLESGCEARAMLASLPGVGSRLDHALANASPDLLIEIGPGRGLAERAAELGVNSLSLETGNGPLTCFLSCVAAAFAAGHPVNAAALYEDRRLGPQGARLETLRSLPAGAMPGNVMLSA